MKKIFHLALAAAMIFGAASCSRDNDLSVPAGDGNGTMTFELKGLNKVTTYATVPIKTTAESDIVGAVSVYMFKASDNKLVKAYTTGGANCALNGQKITITNLKDYMGQQMNFYIVANPTPTTAITVTEGTTTEAQLTAQLTKALTNDGTYITEKLATPLLLTGKTTAAVEVSASATASISLKRSVARFDVVNPMTDFVIDEIYVSHAMTRGYIFPQTALPSAMALSMKAFAGPVLADYETIGSERIARSVFYTYPTDMDMTDIAVKAHFGAAGTPKIYTIESDKDILANNRYKIVCQNVNGQIELSLVVVEWNEGEEFMLEEGTEDSGLALGGLSLTGGASLANMTPLSTNMTYNFNDNNGGNIIFWVSSKYGTNYTIEYADGLQSDLTQDVTVNKSTVTTYGYYSTKDTYTIAIPKTSAPTDFDIKVRISSINDPSVEPVVVSIKREFNTSVMAFVNQPLADYLDDKGYVVDGVANETAINSVTELFVSSDYGLTSTRGFNIFPNLEKLWVNPARDSGPGGEDTETMDLDLRGCSKLQYFELSSPGCTYFTSINLTECPELREFITYYATMISSMDLSGNPKLKNLNIEQNECHISGLDVSGCPDLESLRLNMYNEQIDLSNNRKLQNLELMGPIPDSLLDFTKPEYANLRKLLLVVNKPGFDLSRLTLLQELRFYSSSVGWIDMSTCRQMTYFFAPNNSQIYVWSGFPVATPATQFTTGYFLGSGSTFITTPRP